MAKLKLADRLHRGFVWACVGFTFLTTLSIGVKGYEYIVYLRPIRKAEEAKIERELLKEGQGFPDDVKIPA